MFDPNEMTRVGYNVVFIMDYMSVQTTVDFEDGGYNDVVIVNKANKLILDNYGFAPLDLCYDYEMQEL